MLDALDSKKRVDKALDNAKRMTARQSSSTSADTPMVDSLPTLPVSYNAPKRSPDTSDLLRTLLDPEYTSSTWSDHPDTVIPTLNECSNEVETALVKRLNEL
jgi:hypothetical protein